MSREYYDPADFWRYLAEAVVLGLVVFVIVSVVAWIDLLVF